MQIRSLTIAVLLVLCGCATEPQALEHPRASSQTITEDAKPSGFLRDYSKLKPSPFHANTRYEQSPKLATYSEFIVDQVVVLATSIDSGQTGSAAAEPLDASSRASLAQIAREQVVSTIGVSNRVVEQPGPGVARVKIALTRLGALRAQGQSPSRINAAAVEIEIVDSVSGERLGAAIEADRVNPDDLYDSGTSEGASGRFDLARLVFTHWAARLNLWIERAKRGE